jgi:hypothetical protein
MSIFTKLCRRLPGSIVLLIAVCVAAQQVTQQPVQRPRRVNGSDQQLKQRRLHRNPMKSTKAMLSELTLSLCQFQQLLPTAQGGRYRV